MATAVMTGTCNDCGADIRTEIPQGAPAYLRRMARERMERGPLTQCETCHALSEKAENDVVAAEERRLALEQQRRLMGMPAKWVGQTFAMLDEEPERVRAIELAHEWADGEITGLVLHGGVGRGKTAVAAAAANAMMERGRPVRWIPVSELMHGLRSGFGTDEYERACKLLEPGRRAPGLVLDDLDKLKATAHAVEPIYLAINKWETEGLPLLVTLNKPMRELAAWLPEEFGEAIVSRLYGYCKIREVGGVDRRTA